MFGWFTDETFEAICLTIDNSIQNVGLARRKSSIDMIVNTVMKVSAKDSNRIVPVVGKIKDVMHRMIVSTRYRHAFMNENGPCFELLVGRLGPQRFQRISQTEY